MTELETLKQELKKINAEYAGIRDVPVEKRAEFGREINARKQEILAKKSGGRKGGYGRRCDSNRHNCANGAK